jgi:hypothetical protein
MSERSLPPFGSLGSGFSPFSLVKRAAGRLKSRLRRTRPGEETPGWGPEPDPDLRNRAAAAIQEYAAAHPAIFERAERLRARADRLEREGTPSDSARNRAERAEGEVRAGLAGLRKSFARPEDGGEGYIAFDREAQLRYPALKMPDGYASPQS